MGQFNLTVQFPRGQKSVHGVLTITDKDRAIFFSGDAGENSSAVATLERIQIEHASSHGIMLSGVEQWVGNKLMYQKWWLAFAGSDK